ncbi:hypothetical protein [Ferrimonas sp. SCSIO 43195]|uniref:hypothetical protein n=1 Tax=Ferrimonas sp. SCSIO 43195 TaxID=2822844 RepID=UPI0020755135|nr:hypothetical protein [Ferrimonas sp. SCSIO 43195]USD39589.1 hypothetical protein J8Z22_11130 [Ferrimonas sp. SCSIO 43195]
MEHKVYDFDWHAFSQELMPVLERSLSDESTVALIVFINENVSELTDPYEGNKLKLDWKTLLETGSIQELGDFALTKYYNVLDDFGLAELWLPLQERLPSEAKEHLLGFPIANFDPGCCGSYFQMPEDLTKTYKALSTLSLSSINEFTAAIKAVENGLYVTF